MDQQQFERQVKATQERLRELGERVDQPDADARALAKTAIEELSVSLEELHVAQEELRQQNEELAAARDALEAERRRYRELFAFAPDGYLVTDTQGVIREANRAAVDLLGVQQDQLEGKPLVLFVPEGERAEFYAQINRLRAEEAARREPLQMRLEPRDGEPFHAAVTVVSARDGEGELDGLRWLVRDVTARKRAEQALRGSEKRFRTLFHSLRDGVFVHPIRPENEPGPFEQVNEAACAMLGYSPDELGQMTPWDLDDPDTSSEYVPEAMRQLQESGQAVFEAVQVAKDGHKVPVEVNAHIIELEGEPYIISVVRDITERKRMEEALREREERLRTVSELVSDYAYVVQVEEDGSLTLEWVSEAFFQDTGRELSREIADAPINRTIYPDDLPILQQRMERLLSNQEDVSEYRIVTASGDVRWLRDYGRPVWDEAAGRVVRVIGAAQDITERKRAEQALRESERKYRTLFEDALNPILVVDEDGRYIDANQAALDFLECEREELLDKSVWNFAAPGTLEEAREEHEPFVEARTLETDYFINGRTKTLLLNVVPLNISGETVLYGIGQDITERKRVQERLAFQSMLLDQIQDMVTATDLEGRITYVNQAECRAIGKTADELIGQHVESYGEDPERGATQQEIIETTRTEGEWRGEVVNIADDGREIIIDCRTRLVHDERGEPVGMVGISTDITERKEAEEEIERYAAELERSNRDLERFGYVISHDLREPVRVVKGYLELLERRYRGQLDEKADMYIDYAVDGAERMEKMIRALLNLSRVGTRGQEPAPTEAEAVLERTLKSLERAIEEAQAQVTHGPLPTVMADEAQLGQVFQNLVANAIKFRREDAPPRVHISAEEADGEWIFSVEDNGIGIDPKQAERIFQVFERLHTNEEYPGLGVGLALCRRIVERHGGRIWVESEPGERSTFMFTLPHSDIVPGNV